MNMMFQKSGSYRKFSSSLFGVEETPCLNTVVLNQLFICDWSKFFAGLPWITLKKY